MNPAGLAAHLRREAVERERTVGRTTDASSEAEALAEAETLRRRADAVGQPFRLLVTGPREYTDHIALRDELDWFADRAARYGASELTVVHGACYPSPLRPSGVRPAKSADWLAHLWATLPLPHPLPVRDEPHPADWTAACRPTCTHKPRRVRRGRSICQAAGNYRNGDMVALGADEAAVFGLEQNTSGTRDCFTRIRAAGIPTPRLDTGALFTTTPEEATA